MTKVPYSKTQRKVKAMERWPDWIQSFMWQNKKCAENVFTDFDIMLMFIYYWLLHRCKSPITGPVATALWKFWSKTWLQQWAALNTGCKNGTAPKWCQGGLAHMETPPHTPPLHHQPPPQLLAKRDGHPTGSYANSLLLVSHTTSTVVLGLAGAVPGDV